jgi:Family of unknown function (DUF5985)
MAAVVYLLGTLVTLICAVLLLRAFTRARTPLLLWSGLCFVLLTVSNSLLFVDLVLLTHQVNLYVWRLATAAAGMLLLLYGLVFESE